MHIDDSRRTANRKPNGFEKRQFPIERIRVPASRAKMLKAEKVLALAEEIMANGQRTPILLRSEGDCFVLIEGLHRLEAMRALSEEMIDGYLVRGRMH